MRSRFILTLLTVLAATAADAQNDRIESDRPSESQTAATTQKGYLQFEIGIRKEQQDPQHYFYYHPRADIKYGLFDRLELRMELTGDTEKDLATGTSRYGLQPAEFGLKAKLWEGKGAFPTTSFMVHLGLPTLASDDFKTDEAIPKVRFLFENRLSSKVKLNYNAGAEWQGDGSGPQWLYTLSPEFAIGKSWEAFVEVFGYLKKGEAPQHSFDAGIAYYVSQHVKLDLYGGKGISSAAPEYFVSAGVSFRLKP